MNSSVLVSIFSFWLKFYKYTYRHLSYGFRARLHKNKKGGDVVWESPQGLQHFRDVMSPP